MTRDRIKVKCPDCGAEMFTLRFADGGHLVCVAPCDECPAWWQMEIWSDGCMSFEVAPEEKRWDKDAD